MLAVIGCIVVAPYSVSALQFKHLHPQTTAIRDSLLTTLQRYDAEHRSDTGVVRCLNGLAWQYWQSRPHVALGYAERALNMAQKLGDRLGEANAQMRLGSIFRRLNDKDRSVAAYTACIQQARALGDSDLVGLALNGMALMFQKRGQPEASLRLHLQHIHLRESIKDTVSQFAPFLNIGELYASQHQYGLALEYLHKGVDVLATRPPTAGLSTLYSTISRVHLAQKHYAVAIENARKAQQVAAQVNDLESMVSVMETMGNIYAAQGSLNLALEQYSHALQSLRDRGYDNDRPSLLCAIGDVYLQQGNVQKALEFAERAVKASEHALWTDRERSLELLSQAFTLAGRRTEALQAFERAQQIHDSVLTNDNRVQMAELETQFSKERQRLVIQRLEGDEKRQQLLVYAFGAISFLLLVWSVTALVMVRWQRRNRTQLQQREALLKQVQSLGKMAGFECDVLTNRLTITEEMFLIVERKSNTATYTIEDFFSRIHAGDEIRVRQAFQEAQNTDKRLFVECRAITPDGRTKFLAVGGTVERDQSGHPVRMIGFVQDVTENAMAKNVLVTTRTMLAGVMSSSLDGIMTFVSLRNENKEINDFQCTMANPVAERSLGAAADGLIARRLRDTIDENPLSGLFPQCVKVVSTGTPERFEYAWKYAGVHCWMQVVIVKLGDGFVLTFSDITSRKHAEESLRVSEQKLKALFNSTSEMFFLIGTQHELLAYNNAAAHSLRMATGREPFIGDSLLHYFRHDAARDAFQAHHQEALNVSIQETEDLYIGPSGAAEWHLIRYLPVYNDTGTVFAVSLILLNIHARKQAEERIRESEEQLRRVQRIGKIAGMTLNIETLEMEWTEEFYAIVERSPEELPKVLASLEVCVHPADVLFVRNTLIQAMRSSRSDETLEYRIITPSGRVKFVVTELTIVYNHATQRAVEMVGFVQDITERKRVEKEQRQSEHLYRQLVEASPDAIAVIDTEGRFVSANQRQATMLGFRSPQELIGRLEAEFVESENLPEFAHRRMNASSEMIDDQTTIVNLEVVFVRKDGRRITAESSLVMLRDDRNEPAGTLVISRDITERKEFEEELKKAKADAEAANKLKSEFVANISHEIRTPMNAIIGFSELLREQVQDFMLDSYVQGINTAANTLLMLINDVLDISKIEAGRLDVYYEPVQPFKILVEMQQTFFAKTREKGVEFVIDVADDFPETILLDEIRLRQILLNLLSNAVKFTDTGSVSLILRATPALLANTTAAPSGEHRLVDLSFAVRDTGIGIPAEQQETVFEAFRQQEGQNSRRYGGTGLGLTISRRLAEMMGGRIEVESGVGTGSVFTLHLPSMFVVENRAAYDALANRAPQLSQTISGANVRLYTPLVDAAAAQEFFAGTYRPLTDTSSGKYTDQYSSTEATDVSSQNAVAVPTVLAESLQGTLMDEWRSIGGMMNNLDIEHFAERVRSLGKEYSIVNLANYGDDLYRKTIAFKIVEMNTAFEQFPRVVEELLDSVQPNE
jgi:PAS domain S-box-containing protein